MEAPHEQDMPPIDKYWSEAAGLTIWEAAYWVENGGHADAWIAEQAADDLWQVRKAGMPKVQRAELMAA